MLLLDALYINNSGGKVLLDYLIQNLIQKNIDCFYLIDNRCEESYNTIIPTDKVLYLKASLKNRTQFYKSRESEFSHIFCFANLAPPVKCKGKVFTYFHNLLLSEIPANTPIKKRILLTLKQFIAKRIKNNSNEYIVQTSYAKQSFQNKYGKLTTSILPLYNDFGIKPAEKIKNTYLYVSDGNSHKNHTFLFDAWRNAGNKTNELILTISNSYPDVLNQINLLKNEGFNIKNLQNLSRTELNKVYATAEYMIYPSLLESFGLGLIEGALAHCKIIASDLPYTYQVIKPSVTFNPQKTLELINILKNIESSTILPNTELIVKDEVTELIEKITK